MNMHGIPSRPLTTSSDLVGTSPLFGALPTAIFAAMRGPTVLPKQGHPPQSPAVSYLPARPGFSPRQGSHFSSDRSKSSRLPIFLSNSLPTYTSSTGQTPVQYGGCFATDRLQTQRPISQQTCAHVASTSIPHTTFYVTVHCLRCSEQSSSSPPPATSTR